MSDRVKKIIEFITHQIRDLEDVSSYEKDKDSSIGKVSKFFSVKNNDMNAFLVLTKDFQSTVTNGNLIKNE